MGNRILTILEQVQEMGGNGLYDAVINVYPLPEKPSPVQQAKAATAVLDKLAELAQPAVIKTIMQSCGKSCISQSVIQKARTMYTQAADFAAFLQMLNATRIGGGALCQSDGAVLATYHKCYCGLAKNAKGLSPNYCYCSAGWFQTLFEEATGKQANVELLDTIANGAAQCTFRITLV